MTRAEAARKLCEHLACDVAAIAPVGIGHWPEAWEIVAPADSSFVIALTAWEATGSESDRTKVRAAYHAVLAAWGTAVEQVPTTGAGRMMSATTPTERLTQAREHLSAAFEALEDGTSALSELERHAVLELRADVQETIRRLGYVLAFAEREGTR